MRNNKSGDGGIGFFGVLTIVLIVLKITGVISISWGWVFSPILAGFVMTILLVLFVWRL